jgi:hypothetical protein
MAQASKDIRIKVLSCRLAYNGNKNGTEFSIYEIEACKPDGTPINESLRAFSSLPLGQEVDVTVTPYNSEKYGRSFTLAPKGRKSSNFGEAVNELTTVVNQQREMISLLSDRVGELERVVMARAGGQTKAQPDPAALDEKFGTDPAW